MENVSWRILALQNLRCYNGIMNTKSIKTIPDEQLLAELKAAVASERRSTAQLIELLAEVDNRRLYLPEGYSSLFTYCTQCLHLSEHAAYAESRLHEPRGSFRACSTFFGTDRSRSQTCVSSPSI